MEGTIGEIRLFAGPVDARTNMVPRGWKVCDGSLLNIQEQKFLFAVIGTFYGGNGRDTFALPDLRGRVPVGTGTASGRPAYLLGEEEGAEQVPTEPVAVGTFGGFREGIVFGALVLIALIILAALRNRSRRQPVEKSEEATRRLYEEEDRAHKGESDNVP